jgi:hypothetical protein
MSLARFADPSATGGSRMSEPLLCFVPYYRFTGAELRWTRQPPSPEATSDLHGVLEGMGAGLAKLAVVVAGLRDSIPERAREPEIEIAGRHLEKNFIACHADGLATYSLGVRPSVLRLELFRHDALPAGSRALAVTLPATDAWARGQMGEKDSLTLAREFLGCVLSIIYFPFWVIETRRPRRATLTILDAVTGAVVRRDAPLDLFAKLGEPASLDAPTLGLRALACPNCGWDLPVDAQAVVFPCATCKRAWQSEGDRMVEVPVAIARTAGENGRPRRVKYLPIWQVELTSSGAGVERLLAPAFPCRGLRQLGNLALRLSRADPALPVTDDERDGLDLETCALAGDDAVSLARFIARGLARERSASDRTQLPERSDAIGKSARLLWLPFELDGYSLCEPRTGASVPQNLIADSPADPQCSSGSERRAASSRVAGSVDHAETTPIHSRE